jgi:hypothetical protein
MIKNKHDWASFLRLLSKESEDNYTEPCKSQRTKKQIHHPEGEKKRGMLVQWFIYALISNLLPQKT